MGEGSGSAVVEAEKAPQLPLSTYKVVKNRLGNLGPTEYCTVQPLIIQQVGSSTRLEIRGMERGEGSWHKTAA